MMTMRLLQLSVFAAVCMFAFAQGGPLGEIAASVHATAPEAQSHALPSDALGTMLGELRS